MNKPTFSSTLIENSENGLFVRAVLENSPIEMDWLWLATQVNNPAEKRYCYQTALYINPNSEEAAQGLMRLHQPAASKWFERAASALDFLVSRSAFQHLTPVRK